MVHNLARALQLRGNMNTAIVPSSSFLTTARGKDNRPRRESDSPNLTTGEIDLMNHISMFGSAGYPVQKMGRSWHWVEFFGVKGAPTVYKTKREAVQAFERYMDVLRDRLAGRLE